MIPSRTPGGLVSVDDSGWPDRGDPWCWLLVWPEPISQQGRRRGNSLEQATRHRQGSGPWGPMEELGQALLLLVDETAWRPCRTDSNQSRVRCFCCQM